MKTKSILILTLLLLGAPAMSESTTPSLKTASFGGGCFWCLEPFFEKLKGVSSVVSGYQGGEIAHPTYRQITTGKTGHAEVVQVTYDPDVITYGQLIEVFFMIHDPTTLNRQGNDIGTQYRSVIFVDLEEERTLAKAAIKSLTDQGTFSRPIVTTIEKGPFYKAEDYHQDYYANNPRQGYCQFVIAPKLKKIKLPAELLK